MVHGHHAMHIKKTLQPGRPQGKNRTGHCADLSEGEDASLQPKADKNGADRSPQLETRR